MWRLKAKKLDTVCSVCTSGVSVVCMSSMGAALAAAGASAGAGATSLASIHAQMGHTGATSSVFLSLARFFERIGLDVLNNIPNQVAQPILVAALIISLAAAYLAYLGHRKPHALLLTFISSIALYVGIYVWMSDALFFLGLGGLLGAGIWGMFLGRRPSAAPQSRPARVHV